MALFEVQNVVDKKYTTKVGIPQYLPSSEKPKLNHLFNSEKTDLLVERIKNSNVSPEEKDFLIKAAQRHLVFNYAKIADYYAHSNKEMQELMEESALVIIDINDAIANGYVKLSKNIKKIMQDSGEKTDEK